MRFMSRHKQEGEQSVPLTLSGVARRGNMLVAVVDLHQRLVSTPLWRTLCLLEECFSPSNMEAGRVATGAGWKTCREVRLPV